MDDRTLVVAALLSVVEAVAPVDEDEDKGERGSRVLSHEGDGWADDWEERDPGDRC